MSSHVIRMKMRRRVGKNAENKTFRCILDRIKCDTHAVTYTPSHIFSIFADFLARFAHNTSLAVMGHGSPKRAL